MKYKYLIIFIFQVLLTMNIYSQQLKISGSIKGLDSEKVFLLHQEGSNLDTIAEIVSKEETFSFTVTAENLPSFYFIRIANTEKTVSLLPDQGHISISGDMNEWPNVHVNGSSAHQDYEKYHSIIGPIKELGKKATDLYQQAISDGDSVAAESLMQKLQSNITDYENKQKEFVKSHPHSLYTPVIIANAKWTWYDKKAAYAKLTDSVKKSNFGITLKNQLELQKAQAGILEENDLAPDFTAPSVSGEQVSLKDVISTHKLTLVNFWASWCVPCRAEHPFFNQLYNVYKNKGFSIVNFSVDTDEKLWKQAVIKDTLSGYNISDLKGDQESPIAKKYNIFFVPQTFLVGKDGKIVSMLLKGEMLKNKIQQILE